MNFAMSSSGLTSAPVFQSKDDPDYQKIIRTFDPLHELLKKRPRADMPEFKLVED